MNAPPQVTAKPKKAASPPISAAGRMLQRKCACGGTPGPSGECAACRRKRLGLQPKLTVNPPGDRFEQEADRVAEQVLRMPGPAALPLPVSAVNSVQRQPAEEEEEEELQTKAEVGQTPAVSADTAARIEQLRGGGEPLPDESRRFFETRFGHDFGRVRLHTGARAAQAAHSVQARAFTLGSDIVFNRGEYAPHSPAGQRLLAHELTHVVQQRQGSVRIQRACDSLKQTINAPAIPGRPSRASRFHQRDCCPEDDSGCAKSATVKKAYEQARPKVELALNRLRTVKVRRRRYENTEELALAIAFDRAFGDPRVKVSAGEGRQKITAAEQVTDILSQVSQKMGQSHIPLHSATAENGPAKASPQPETEPTPPPPQTKVPAGTVPNRIPGEVSHETFTRAMESLQPKRPPKCPDEPLAVKCALNLDPTCGGALAFYHRPSQQLFMCDSFFTDLTPLQQEITIIHEFTHAALPQSGTDIYSQSRLFAAIRYAEDVQTGSKGGTARRNPDAFAAFVILAANRSPQQEQVKVAGQSGLELPQEDNISIRSARRRQLVEIARGFADDKLRTARLRVQQLSLELTGYNASWGRLSEPAKWTLAELRGETGIGGEQDCGQKFFRGLAPGSGCPWANLTGGKPTEADRDIIDRILENITELREASFKALTVESVISAPIPAHWDKEEGKLTLAGSFFKRQVSDETRTEMLLQALIAASPKIRRFQVDYLEFIKKQPVKI